MKLGAGGHWLIVAALLISASPACAAVQAASSSQIALAYEVELAGAPAEAWQNLTQISTWWSSDHTYSGQAKNLSLDVRPGGCWCETWATGGVEHARVIMAMPGKALRIEGGFGPLQGMAVRATMTFSLKPATQAGKTKLQVTYLVNGSPESKLDGLAAPIDGVLATQFGRLAALGR